MAFTEAHLDQLDRIMARTIALNLDAGMDDRQAFLAAFDRMKELTPNTANIWWHRHAS